MPRIQTESLSTHRDWRRTQLIQAAASIALESGGSAVTVAAVAQRAGSVSYTHLTLPTIYSV